jgi:hypothetical protein
MMKDQLRKEHEEEISALMDENSKLEEELQEAKRKVSVLSHLQSNLRIVDTLATLAKLSSPQRDKFRKQHTLAT